MINKKLAFPGIMAVILLSLFITMNNNWQKRFEIVNEKLRVGRAINLDKKVNVEKLADLLYIHNYIEDSEDALFAARFIKNKLTGDTLLEALQDFNKRIWQIPVTQIDSSGSKGFRKKMMLSREALGLNESVITAYQEKQYPTIVKLQGKDNGFLMAKVVETVPTRKLNFWDRLLRKNQIPMEGTLVRLDKHETDSIGKAEYTIMAYAMTDQNGMVRFEGLDMTGSYSIIPIRLNYEFGLPQGTEGGTLADWKNKKTSCFTFIAQPHKIRLFSNNVIQRMREDQLIIVRTPDEFRTMFQIYFCIYFISWLILFISGHVRKGKLDNIMAAQLMTLTGLSFLLMFGINEPLTERLLGVDTAQGIIAGVGIAALLQQFNILKFFQNRYRIRFDILEKPLNKLLEFFCLPYVKGLGYLFFAILLTGTLLIAGQAVGGMKVNLNLMGLIFQPSEIAKYLIVIFMAAFFYDKGESIVRYSNAGIRSTYISSAGIWKLFGRKIHIMAGMLIGLGTLLILYMILGDMGPAMVISLTFIILYSLVKSRSELNSDNNKEDENMWKCDLFIFFIGIISFFIFLIIGQIFKCQFLLCITWFIVWILIGLKRKQISESAIMFNIIIAFFIFSGDALRAIGQEDIAKRLAERKEMCTNTWGNPGLDNGTLDPGINTQVAEGLWGLASGGIFGQGLGNGASKYIPAYHTDMILQSIGEQTGFIGILIVLILISQILYRTLLAGYRTNHLFILYLCAGIAIVTAVQLLIIALGSTGFIPLTGITVPLLSYGRVSMILNLAAFGIVLSITSRCQCKEENYYYIQKYSDTLILASTAYTLLICSVLSIFFYYQVPNREKTMLKPVVVYNTQGAVTVQYNPRIEKLVEKMKPGNIYDRKGILIATSFADSLIQYRKIYNKYNLNTDFRKNQQRFYPFGEHLFFILGDYNTKMFFSSLENSPRGYMAEARYLSVLRGYDNILYDDSGNRVLIDLYSDRYQPGRFYPANHEFKQTGFQLRDYSALLPYLKAGYNSDRIDRYNAREEGLLDFSKIKPQDITLTIDACLQTKLQQKLSNANKAGLKKWQRFQRTSVIVMDAESGDLLASANYPLPDFQRLTSETENYTDNYRSSDWHAYTDCDLGMIYPTAPGSSAKVISALAGLRHLNNTNENIMDSKFRYYVYEKERIHTGLGGDPTGWVNFQQAIIQSSNNYFINLVNDQELYDELAHIYASAGIYVDYTPAYKIDYAEYNPQNGWVKKITDASQIAPQIYRNYIENRTDNPQTHKRMVFCDPWWRWTWGQGTISATPLAMARIAATVINNGKMPVTRYIMTNEKPTYVDIVSNKQIDVLQEAMIAEAHKPLRDGSRRFAQYKTFGGKTGTPERIIKWEKDKIEKPNDAWYISFVKNANVNYKNKNGKNINKKTSIAIVVRTERTGNAGSNYAKNLTDKVIMPVLDEMGYVE